jgi:hypothetical protein
MRILASREQLVFNMQRRVGRAALLCMASGTEERTLSEIQGHLAHLGHT